MKRYTSATLFLLAAALAVACLLQGQPLFASGAIVLSGPCGISGNLGEYQSHGTFIMTPSGQISGSCHASLVSGPGVTQLTHVHFIGGTPFGPAPYSGVLTPSGQAELFVQD